MHKYLIVGLGNIGEKYKNTRHNIGFLVIDELIKKFDLKPEQKNFGTIAQFKYKARPVTLLKPDTYMNLSGNAIKFWLEKEKIPTENLFVITDDLNLAFGTIRIRGKGSDGGHNGLKNIQENIGQKYPRLRFGISNDFDKGKQINYVLSSWNKFENQHLNKCVNKMTDAVLTFVFNGLAEAMNQHNGQVIKVEE